MASSSPVPAALACVLLLACDPSSGVADAAGGDAASDDASTDVAPRDAGPPDADGDGIPDDVEKGPDPARPMDSDGDGTPDYLDLDSDGDTISDAMEWIPALPDEDGDGLANYVDLDSDGDGVLDDVEAGDSDLGTPPVSCPHEVAPDTLTELDVHGVPYSGDGIPDWLDLDSDNDGLGDGDEQRLGTNPCAFDSDGDGVGDAFEAAYADAHCATDPSTCHAATDAATTPSAATLLVLRFDGARANVRIDVTLPTTFTSAADVDLVGRSLPNPLHLDTSVFVKSAVTGCSAAAPDTVDPCWAEPAGTTHAGAVASTAVDTFFGVAPGTRLTFVASFYNDAFAAAAAPTLVALTVDARADGTTVFSVHEVYVIIPARAIDPFGP